MGNPVMSLSNCLVLVCMFAVLVMGPHARAQETDVSVELGGIGHDIALDRIRRMVYVSVPSRNEIVKISSVDYSIVQRVVVGSSPQGIDLSIDRTVLYIALNQAGAIAVLDLETGEVEEIVVGDVVGHSSVNDVVEATQNQLFVSANPGSGGFAWIAKVSLDQGNMAQRVASNRIIRANPVFEVSPDRAFLYIGEGFSPNSLYKLDLSQETAPIVLEDDHGSVSGTRQLEVSPDGGRIYLTSGQVLRTGSFIQAGSVASGIHQFGADPSRVYVVDEPNEISTYDTETFLEIASFNLNCSFQNIRKMVVLPGDFGWLVLGDDLLCGRTFPNPGAEDCNSNGLSDLCDLDCNAEDPITLEDCALSKMCGSDVDCNANGVPDGCEPDCNDNGTADDCDIMTGTSDDCDANGVPDDCQPDCNRNAVADVCDLVTGTSTDCFGLFGNGIPDECETDCNKDGMVDSCGLDSGLNADCNANLVPDDCDIASGISTDCNQNSLLDECESAFPDCNANEIPDNCEIALIHGCCDTVFWDGCLDPGIEQCVCDFDPYCCVHEWDRRCAEEVEELNCGTCDLVTDCNRNTVPDECEIDCNENGTADECDVSAGFEQDCQPDGIPDSCQPDFDQDQVPDECDDDADGDGVPNVLDDCPTTPLGVEVDDDGRPFGDIDHDCITTITDFGLFHVCLSLSGPDVFPGFQDCIDSFSSDADHDVDLFDFAVFARNIVSIPK